MTEFRQWWRRNTRAGYAFAEVSLLHWGSTFGIWKRSLLRSISWAGVLPLAIVVGALVHPNAVALLALYPIQIARIAYRNGWNRSRAGEMACSTRWANFLNCAGLPNIS